MEVPVVESYICEMLRFSALRLSEAAPEHAVNDEKFREYMETFVWSDKNVIHDKLTELSHDLWFSLVSDNKESLSNIEKLLVGLLGHWDSDVRDEAVVHLNCFYDDSDWQMAQPFKPKVITCGSKFLIEERVEGLEPESIFMQLKAPSQLRTCKHFIISYHTPDVRKTERGFILKVDLGEFTRCGFYDWRFVRLSEGTIRPLMSNFSVARSSMANLVSVNQTFPVQGRFIVHPPETKDLQIHEVFIDFQDAHIDPKTGVIKERGNFKSVRDSLAERYSSGINCLYLMGVFERDNGYNFENPDASPLSLIDRSNPSRFLGGVENFKGLMKEASQVGMKIIVDGVARISSKNFHRRYKNNQLYIRNELGLPVVCYGTDGRALKFEDSALLNYRKAEVWKLLVDDILRVANTYGVNGVHLDNAQAWPQIMELDKEEMYRLDSDSEYHYTSIEIFEGHIVKRNENFAYWSSSKKDQYPNPIFLKLCKELWREYPEFYIVADIWHGSGLEDRDRVIARSGPIPRLYDLPIKLASIFGKRLHKNGGFEPIEKRDVSVMRTWYDERKRKMPEGAIIIQSSTGHSLPYPALLYGRGAWAAVDVLFFMPDIPMTFIGEQAGFTYRSKIANVYDFDHEIPKEGMNRVISGIALTQQPLIVQQSSVPKVASAASLSVIPNITEVIERETKYARDLGPEFGFDLTKIKNHYKHRRDLRHEQEVLRKGELIPLVLRHEHGWHKQVMVFSRWLRDEVAIIAINFNDHPVSGYLDLKNLSSKMDEMEGVIYSIGKWFSPETDEYYFKEELILDQHYISILPYHSEILGIYPSDQTTQVTLKESIERLKNKISKGMPIDGSYSVIQLLKCIDRENLNLAIKTFANTIGLIYKHFLEVHSISPLSLIKSIKKLDDKKAARILAFCDTISSAPGNTNHAKQFAKKLVEENIYGPIVFTAPEMGRFSTAGGLGVMVDELAQGLAILGEEVWVISPYYERNKKDETGYLANDPAGIKWVCNIDVSFGGESYVLGVHQGFENGVNLLFLHNAAMFPTVYADGRGSWVMKQLVVWARGTLEALCHIRKIPSILVTNDWFTGLVAAYAKLGMFGETFQGTTFLHIVHNLDASYEGRLYPDNSEGFYQNLHGLPRHLLVDPYWARQMVNPSRCALMMSDHWATVSPSYRNELLASSPLKELLKQKDKPFAFPNGIPVEQRLDKLRDKGDHMNAKGVIQKKYFSLDHLDNSFAVLAFVGRIVEQKGVHLIIDAAEQLIPKYNFKLQFLVGGPANYKDKYAAGCATRLKNLHSKYPHCFYANPDEFFSDGPWVNLGADFALMPSMFEPGGIVQHEFFVAGTPVVAFKTGGLRDTVHEFNPKTEEGCGFTFESYEVADFIFAIERALEIYKDSANYGKLRANAAKAVMDGATVSRAWNREFYRLKSKLYFEPKERKQFNDKLRSVPWSSADYDSSLPANKIKQSAIKRTPSGTLLHDSVFAQRVVPTEDTKRHVLFRYQAPGLRLKSVQLTGSFDNWQIRHPLIFDHTGNMWHVTLQLAKGDYSYKFIVDGVHWVVSYDHPTGKDSSGNTNNIMVVN
jgi:glycogen synthase